jgi:ribosomal 50S subunit-associated protein YjgA (DUF615 family)
MSNDTPPQGSQQVSGDGYWMMVIERLTRIETTLEGIRRDRDEMKKDTDDHEGRLRALERWRYMLPSSLVTAAISAGVTIYGQLGR